MYNRVLGVYSSDLEYEPRFPIHSSGNMVTISYHVGVLQNIMRGGKYIISYWRLEWNAEMESTKLLSYYKT